MKIAKPKVIMSAIAAALLGAGALVVPAAQADDTTSPKVEAHSSEPAKADVGTRATRAWFTGDGIAIRTRPADGAIVGRGYRGHKVTFHCSSPKPGAVWFKITDNTTGVTGYSLSRYVGWDLPHPGTC